LCPALAMCWPTQFTQAPALRAWSITNAAVASSSRPMMCIGLPLRNCMSSCCMTLRLESIFCSCMGLPLARPPSTKAQSAVSRPTRASTGRRPAPAPGAPETPASEGNEAPMVSPARLPQAIPLSTKRRSTLMMASSGLLYQRQGCDVLGHLGDGFIIDVGIGKGRHGVEAVAHDGLDIGLRQATSAQRRADVDFGGVAVTAYVVVQVFATVPLRLLFCLSGRRQQYQWQACQQDTLGSRTAWK